MCGEVLDAGEIVVVTRESKTLRKCSLTRCDGIHNAPEGLNVATVHVLCRKNYTRFPNAAAAPSSSTTTVSEKHILRSCVIDFDYKMPCFLIAKEISESSKYKHSNRQPSVSEVRTLNVIDTITAMAKEKREDDWGRSVTVRQAGVIDLVTAEGLYHHQLYKNFRRLGSSLQGVACAHGRPENTQQSAAFDRLCNCLETNYECQYTTNELLLLVHSMNPQESLLCQVFEN